jgi:hypothetical protein
MEAGEPIPDDHHVGRYVSPSKYTNDMLHWSALLPRQQDRGEASFNWLEFFGTCDLETLVNRLKVSLSTNLKLSKNGVFGVLNVGEAKSGIGNAQPGTELRFTYTPKEGIESHASMFGVDETNEAAGKFLRDLCRKIRIS